jgi:hypothetical protein
MEDAKTLNKHISLLVVPSVVQQAVGPTQVQPA